MTWTGLNFSLGMDCQDTFLSRIGQTLWEFLNNVTSAVQRYLTPAPPNTGNDDTNTSPEARVCKEKDSDKEEEENDLIEETERESKCWSHVEKDLDTANETVVHWMRREIVFSNETESMSEQCMRVHVTSTEEEQIAGVGDRFRAEQVNQHPEKAVLEEADNGQEKGNITQDTIKLGVEAGNSCIIANEQERKKQSDKTTANESHKFFDQGIEKKLQLLEETDARLAGDEYSFREEDESEWEIIKQRESAKKYEDLIKSNEVNVFGGHTGEQDETEKVKAEHGVEEMVMTCEDKMRNSDGKTEPVAGETPFREHEVLLCKTKDTIGTEPGETAYGVDVGGAGQGSNEENERSTEETMGIKCITKTSIGVLERRLKEEEMRGEWQGVQKNQRLEKKEKSYKKDMSGVDERDISYLYELGREERIIYVEKGNMQVLTEDKVAEEDRKEGESKVEINTEVQPEQNKKADKTSKENTYEKKQEVKIEGESTSVIFGDFETAIKEVDVSIEEGESDKVREGEENRRAEQNETVVMEAQGREKERVEEEGEVDKWRDELHKEDKSHGSATEDTDESDVVEEGGEDGERERCLFELEKEGNNIYEGITDMEILNEERKREENKINEEVAASWVDVRETMEANEVAEENKDISGTEWGDYTNHDRKLYEENERETGERSSKEEPAGAEVSMEDGASDKVREEEENREAEQNETVEIEVQEREKERVEEEGDVDKWRDELYKEDKSQGSAIEERDESDIVVEGGQDREKERCLFELEEEENNVYEGMRDTEILHEERGREENEIKEEVAAYWVDVRETVEANEVAEENKDISGTEWGDDIIHDRKVYEENEKKTEERSSKEDSPEGMISMEDGKSDKVREEEENRGAEQNEMVEMEAPEREKERVEEEGDVENGRDELCKEDKSQGSATEGTDESNEDDEGGQDREKERCLFELEKEENYVYEGMTDMEILHEVRWREENKINEEVAAYWVDVGETVEANEIAEENKDISETEWRDDINHERKVYEENKKEREEKSPKEEPAEDLVSMEDEESDKVREEEENRRAEQNEMVEMEAHEREKERVEEKGDVDKWRDGLHKEDKSQGSAIEERDESDVVEEGGEDGERERCLFELEKEENNVYEGMRDTEILYEERGREENEIKEEVAASWVDVRETVETNEVAEENKDISGTEWGDDIIHDIKVYENDKEREEISPKEEPAEGVVSMEDGESDKVREEEENRGAEQNETVEMEVQEWLQVREPEVKHETIVAGEEEEEMQRKTQRTRENEVQRPEEYAEMEGTQGNEVKSPERVITLNMRQPERHKEVEEEGDKWRNELDEEDKNQGSVTENREKSDAIEGGEDGEKERCLFELEKEENNLHEGMRDTEIHPEERWREEKKINEEVAASWVDAGESETCEVNVQKISEEENIDISLTEWRDDRKHRESVYGVKEKEILKIYLTEEQHYENINIFNEASDITKETEKKADFEQKEEPCMHEDNVFRGNSHIIDLFKGEQGQETKEEKHDNECLEKLATALIVGKTRNGGNVSDENVDTKTMKEGDGRDLNVAPVTKSELNEGFDANVETKAIALRDGWAIEKTKEASQSGDTRDAMDRGVIRGAESERDFNECTVDTTEGQRAKIQLKTEKGVQLDEDENFTNAREIQSQCSEAEMPETGEHRTETTGKSRTIIVNQERDGNEGRKHITEDEVGKKRTQKRTHESDEEFDLQLDSTSLDFTAQKSRIALKNRQVRAPKNPRILLQKPSLSPTSAPPALVEEEATKPFGIKVGGVGMKGFRLPGIGAGFPVLKKTEIRVEERGQEDTGQMKAPTPNLGPDDREPAATKKWAAGAVGVMLPGFGPGMPALRKTDKEIKLKEKTAEDATVSHGKFGASSGGGAERNREESKENRVKIVGASTIKLPSFGAGFPVLRKTEMGSKLKGEEGKKSEAEWIETENNQPEKAGSDSPMLVSELKKKFMKTERK